MNLQSLKKYLVIVLFTGGLLLAIAIAPISRAAAPNPPIPILSWKPCTESAQKGFQCATAQVPLDYQKPNGEPIQLAVIKHPATNQSHRIGTIFFNPGGPGGSGIEDLPEWFSLFPQQLQQRFDIVSFDPRGIGESTAVECFTSKEEANNFFANVPQGFPIGTTEINIWNQAYRRYGQLCQQRNSKLLDHVSTTDVARDMDLLRQAVGDPTMNYLGVSYGTILGAIYANLFPDKIRTAVLDGNVSPDAWTNGNRNNIQLSISQRIGSDAGAGKALQAFLTLCGQTTPDQCAFSQGSVAATEAKFKTLLERLKSQPVLLQAGGKEYRFTYAMLMNAINDNLFVVHSFGQYKGWSHLGDVLNTLLTAPPATPEHPGETLIEVPDQGWFSVACADTRNPQDLARYPQLATLSLNRAGDIGPALLWGDSPCAVWKGKSAENYTGPWNRPTANPILVVGNTTDPSTPYENSVAMARMLSRARLLTVTGYGHTALLNPSQCANSYVATYFTTGALPPEQTVCKQDQPPFVTGANP